MKLQELHHMKQLNSSQVDPGKFGERARGTVSATQ